MKNDSQGFSLVELLIVVVIIGILSAVAYPSYLEHMVRAQRNDSRAALTRVANDQEKFFATNGAYTTDMSTTSLEIIEGVAHSDNLLYVVTAAAGPTGNIATSYTLTARVSTAGAQRGDKDCVTMTLNSAGQRTPDPATTPCW